MCAPASVTKKKGKEKKKKKQILNYKGIFGPTFLVCKASLQCSCTSAHSLY